MEPITLTLCLLVFAIVMFVWEKVPLAVTSMIVCVALVITGVLNIKQAFAGFIDTNVIPLCRDVHRGRCVVRDRYGKQSGRRHHALSRKQKNS